jgi:rRNA maturation endonuclease Nob1
MKPEERDALVHRLELEADRITCYASTMTEHPPNRSAALMREAAAALTAQSPAGVPPEPTCIDEWACMMPGDCARHGKCLADDAPEAGVPTTEPVAPIARDWMSRNVNEFASHFLRQYDKTTSLRESMMYAFVRTYAAQAPVEPVAQEPEDERLNRLEAMAEDDGETWDLSPNDRAALAWAVETIKRASPISLPVEVPREHCLHCQSPSTCDAVGHCRHGFNTRVTRG